jgi:MFS transporter, MHS family, proline/betaine transporter
MTLSAPAVSPAAIPAQSPNKPIARLVIATSVGNALEWYDIAVYGYFAVYISKAFFPNSDPTISLLLTLGTFALSFLTRPLGGVILGIYADRHGRRASLMISILLMTLGNPRDRVDAGLREHRRCGADSGSRRAAGAGIFRRR